MRPEQGFYEERYRLTGPVAASLLVNLGLLGLAFYGSRPSAWLAVSLLFAMAVTLPSVIAAVSRRVAFRVDPMGITLGADPLSWPGRADVFIPWSDVDKIILYQGSRSRSARRCIGIQRSPGSLPLPRGNGPAGGCPVPGLAEGATRQVVAWRLDRERLTAVTAALAPGVPVIDARGESPAVAGPDPG